MTCWIRDLPVLDAKCWLLVTRRLAVCGMIVRVARGQIRVSSRSETFSGQTHVREAGMPLELLQLIMRHEVPTMLPCSSKELIDLELATPDVPDFPQFILTVVTYPS